VTPPYQEQVPSTAATAASSPLCTSLSPPNSQFQLLLQIPNPNPPLTPPPSLNSATTTLSLPPTSLHLTTYHVVTSPSNPSPAYPSLSQIDAILLTGSKHNSFDNDPWILKLVSFVEEVLRQRRVRIIGVCFGHQIVGRAMGTRVGRSERGWEVSVVPIELTEKGREIFGMKTLVGCFLSDSFLFIFGAFFFGENLKGLG
jgi:hypothetical protein